jgi:hypothetical protein
MQNGKGARLFQEAGGEYFYESGNKIGGFLFRASLLFVPASQNCTYWGQLRAGPAAQGEFCFARLAARLKVVP